VATLAARLDAIGPLVTDLTDDELRQLVATHFAIAHNIDGRLGDAYQLLAVALTQVLNSRMQLTASLDQQAKPTDSPRKEPT
jgi:hypothetical protein